MKGKKVGVCIWIADIRPLPLSYYKNATYVDGVDTKSYKFPIVDENLVGCIEWQVKPTQ